MSRSGTLAGIPDIRNVGGLTPADEDFLRLAAAFLTEHGQADDFGVIRLHTHHFPEPGQIFAEYDGPPGTGVKILTLEDTATVTGRATAWRFVNGMPVAIQVCPTDQAGLQLTPADQNFLRLAARLFERHGMADRFGMNLLRHHFPEPGQIFAEYDGPPGTKIEILTHQPIGAVLAGRATAWRSDNGEPVAMQECLGGYHYVDDPTGNGNGDDD